MAKRLLLGWFVLVGLGSNRSLAQLTPPGLDGANDVGWIAVGFTQSLGARGSVATYVGTSVQSNLANYVFWKKRAISVVNQEWGYQFTKHWQLVVAGSLRSQALYEDVAPYEPREPPYRVELRTYARLFFRHQAGKLSWSHSFRPEYRRFLDPDWHTLPNPYQIRLRLKSQLSYPLNASNTTQFIAANEVLTTVNRIREATSSSLTWSPYQLSEIRLSTFIRRVIKKPALFIDGGLMHQFWWDPSTQQFRYTTYFSVDFVFRNPIKKSTH